MWTNESFWDTRSDIQHIYMWRVRIHICVCARAMLQVRGSLLYVREQARPRYNNINRRFYRLAGDNGAKGGYEFRFSRFTERFGKCHNAGTPCPSSGTYEYRLEFRFLERSRSTFTLANRRNNADEFIDVGFVAAARDSSNIRVGRATPPRSPTIIIERQCSRHRSTQ